MKEKKDISIIFMGTPEFAVTILERIIQEGYNVKAVVTSPDRKAGRGQKIKQSAVKTCAEFLQLPILQPERLKDDAIVQQLQAFHADLFIVVAFRMLPKAIWEIPTLGTFNLHASLLPQYRGAAPINWAIMNGEKETGVTTFLIDEKIDTGKLLLQTKMAIDQNETAGELHDRMMEVGATTVVETIELIRSDKATPHPQPNLSSKPAPKIFKQDCFIDFNQSLEEVHNFIRGLSPYPTAWMKIKHKVTEKVKTIKIFHAEIKDTLPHRSIELNDKDGELLILLPLGTLTIHELQLEGKKRLGATSFLTGFHPEEWEIQQLQ